MRSHTYSSIDIPLGRANTSRRGIWCFIRHNVTVSLALFAGLSLVAATVCFTVWLGKQIPRCPEWSVSCHVSDRVVWIRDNNAIVQGLVTVLYAIGMAAIAYSAHSLSEAAIWPLLSSRTMTLKRVDTYLEASRGSIPSSPLALFAVKDLPSTIVLLCTVIVTLIPLSSAPLVGYVYQRQNITVAFQSQYQPGGGIGPGFRQRNPPSSIREGSASLYTSWASGLALEPLPEHREWFLDRPTLAGRGNISVTAVKMQQNITCRSWEPSMPEYEKGKLYFESNLRNRTGESHDERARVLRLPKLTVWAYDFEFLTPTRTKTTLAFAAINGDIAGGFKMTNLPKQDKDKNFVDTISTIACDVDLEFIEGHLRIGDIEDPNETPARIMALADVMITQPNSTAPDGKQADGVRWDPVKRPEDTLNELALWFTVAPITNGASVSGAQPMYKWSDKMPIHSTTPGLGDPNNKWTIPYIEDFIRASIGASAVGDSTTWDWGDPRIFTSHFAVPKLEPSRYKLLIVPPAITLINGVVLLIMTLYLHRKLRIPIMRLATLSEILKSAQTEDLSRRAANDMLNPNQPSKLDDVAVRFVAGNNGLWGLSCREDEAGPLGQELFDKKSSLGSSATLEYRGFQH